jgi:flagellar biosynthetic protein FlhB
MPEPYAGEKTEPATPRRREEVRKKGQVAKSIDLNSSLVLLAAVLSLYFLAPRLMHSMTDFTRGYLEQSASIEVNPQSIQSLMLDACIEGIKILFPFMVVILNNAVFAKVSQVGFRLSGYPLLPRIEKISPAAGLRRMFSMRAFVELAKAVFKILIVGAIAYITIKSRFDRLLALANVDVWGAWGLFGHITFILGMRIAVAFLLLGLLDYGFQRYQFEQDIKMTKEEVRQEMKDFEGDPQIRARIRRVRRQMAINRMMAEVPKAHVVVTNPTTLAIALRYDVEKMRAPVVVAKGARLMADRIREKAIEHAVPIQVGRGRSTDSGDAVQGGCRGARVRVSDRQAQPRKLGHAQSGGRSMSKKMRTW